MKNMAILKTFLCICNTRTGSLVCGCYTLVSSIFLSSYIFGILGFRLPQILVSLAAYPKGHL